MAKVAARQGEPQLIPAQAPLADLPAPRPWRRRHLLDTDELDSDEIDLVMRTTDVMKEVLEREVPRAPALRGTTVLTLFYEASTRTRASFELAGKVLGADVINVAASGSSIEKGETLLDTVLTVQAIGTNVLVLRHPASGAPYLVARELDLHVINGGDGLHAHPTQALLDAYTIRNRFPDLHGRRVVIVGDVAHSRVARSNLWSLTALGAEVTLCCPPTLLPVGLGTHPDQQPTAGLALPRVGVEHNLDVAIKDADVIMALRLQRERQEGGLLPSLREYSRLYQINTQRLSLANPNAIVLHPGPVNEGVELSAEVAHGAKSVIEEQVANGVAVRMAILYLLVRGARFD